MTTSQQDDLAQWYMQTIHDGRDSPYRNIHEVPAKRYGNEFGVRPVPGVIRAAMLERALHLADILQDARYAATASSKDIPEMNYVAATLRFGETTVNVDDYDPNGPVPWPERADDIIVHTRLTHSEGVFENKAYGVDIAIAPYGEQRGETPLAVLSKNAEVTVEELTAILSRVYGSLDPDIKRDEDAVRTRAFTMATIACVGLSGRLTAIEQLTKTHIIDMLPAPALPDDSKPPIRVTLARTGAEADAPDERPRRDPRAPKARNRRNLHYYEGTPFRNHPGIEHGLRVHLQSDEAKAVRSVPEGMLLQEIGTSVNGTLVKLHPEDRATPAWATHGVVWREYADGTGFTSVHLLDKEDTEKLMATSTSTALESLCRATNERLLLTVSPDATDEKAAMLEAHVMSRADDLSRITARKKPSRPHNAS